MFDFSGIYFRNQLKLSRPYEGHGIVLTVLSAVACNTRRRMTR